MDSKLDKAQLKKDVGRRLKQARLKADPQISQAAAAQQLGELMGDSIEPSAISNYEQGTRLPDPITLQFLCQIYGSSPSYIYGFVDAPTSKEEEALLNVFRQTDDRGRKAIRSIAESQPAYLTSEARKAG